MLNPISLKRHATVAKSETSALYVLPHRPSTIVCPVSKPNQLAPITVNGAPSTPMSWDPLTETGRSAAVDRRSPAAAWGSAGASSGGTGAARSALLSSAHGTPLTRTDAGANACDVALTWNATCAGLASGTSGGCAKAPTNVAALCAPPPGTASMLMTQSSRMVPSGRSASRVKSG